MYTKRIIPCLDVKDGRVVKGINFLNLRDAGDPVEQATLYDSMGADEIVFLDISATKEGKKTMLNVVRSIAENIFLPLTVGGGIRSIDDIRQTLLSGADKISINSAAISNPDLISLGAEKFGNQCIVLAIDAKKIGNKWEVFTHGGSKPTGLCPIEWAVRGVNAGAGEILLTSMDADGTKNGFDIDLLNEVTSVVNVPIIASGGAGYLEHFKEVFSKTKVDAALAATLFHDNELSIALLKSYLTENNIPIRPNH